MISLLSHLWEWVKEALEILVLIVFLALWLFPWGLFFFCLLLFS